MKNIVVISQNRGFFGAQVVHLPLLKMLKLKYPESKIHYFSKSKISKILMPFNLIDELVIEKSTVHFIKKYQKSSADLTINLRQKSIFHTFIIAFLNRKKKVGFSNVIADIFFNYVVDSNTSIYRANNYLSLFKEKIPYSAPLKKKRICIAPGAGCDFKVWHLDNYILLAKEIITNLPNYTVVFILGENEKSYAEKLAVFTTMINSNIYDLFENIDQSELMISNDCGPSHIGHISSTKVISIFSDEFNNAERTAKEWFNNKPGSCLIKGDAGKSINSISVQTVLDKVYELTESPY